MKIQSAALPVIAVLRKGAPKPENGRKPGHDLEYFRVDFPPRLAHLMDAWAALYGAEPDTIPGVRFVTDDPFSFYYELWGQNQTLKARHDGECWIKRWTPQGYCYDREPVDPADPLFKDCQPRGRLTFALPAFFRVTGELGVFTLLTSSIHDAETITAYLALIQAMGCGLAGVDFTLYREPRKFTVPITHQGTGEITRSSITKHMIYLKADPALVRAVLGEGEHMAALPAPEPPVLPPLETAHDSMEDLDSGPSARISWGNDGALVRALKQATGWDGPKVMGRLAHLTNNKLITLETPQKDVFEVVMEQTS